MHTLHTMCREIAPLIAASPTQVIDRYSTYVGSLIISVHPIVTQVVVQIRKRVLSPRLFDILTSPAAIVRGRSKGGSYVVDNRCGTDRSVATRTGEQLHDERVYPYIAGDRHCRGVDQDHSGEK